MVRKNKKNIMMISIHGDPAADIGSEEQGGQPIYIKNISRLLSKDYNIDIFTRKKNAKENEIVSLFENVKIIRIKAGPVKFVPKKDIYLHINEFFMNIIRWIKENMKSYSLIHSHYWYSGSVGLKLKDALEIPMVHNCHSLGKVKYYVLKKAKPPYADMRFLEEELILKRANAVIASSPQEVKNILDLYKVSGENIELIRAGVDKNLFKPISPAKAKKRTGLNYKNLILFVGRITKAKGLSILINALSEVKKSFKGDIKLIVIGGDVSGIMHSEQEEQEKERLKKLMKTLDIEDDVIFLGAVKREILPYYYSIADTCVIPSLYETFGLVAVEAMSCGAPVVASRVGGLRDTIKEGYSGLHFVPGRADSLAKVLLNLLRNPERLKKMKANARKRAAIEFTLERTVQQIKELYTALLF